ncbi:MAG: diguanylate cyclase [Candidatus Hydrogenedentes bacterium]|nr:diguanylate cyclase [Candidatus Hydrogenedentota bacterium]
MKARLLLLDDEVSILEILGQHLSEEYDCTATTSALQALDLLEKTSFDLLITDLKMPEMHGIEVVQRALAHDRDLAVIVVTALLEVTNAIDAMRAGASDYLLKPFNLTEISLAVEKALDRRRLIIENRQYQTELESRVSAATADLERTNRELRGTKEYLENLLESSVDAILTADTGAGRITYVNHAAMHMLGYEEHEFLGKTVGDLFVGSVEESRYVRRLLQENRPLQNYETELLRKDGGHIPINMSISLAKDADGKVVSLLSICKDITEQKRLEQELKELSVKDSLSGLYNQRYFYERLESEIERAQRQGHPLSLLLFDIDQFKTYNDCHGHLEGDKVLKSLGQIVLESTRGHVDIGCRYGGDEFTVILPEADEKAAYAIAERIRASFAARRYDHLTVSIGLMSYRRGTSLRSFVRFVDAMMYDAKRSGGNRVFVYDVENQGEHYDTVHERVPEEHEASA